MREMIRSKIQQGLKWSFRNKINKNVDFELRNVSPTKKVSIDDIYKQDFLDET